MKTQKSPTSFAGKTKLLNTALSILFILFTINGYSCVNCNQEVQDGILQSLYENHFSMFTAFIVLAIVVILLVYLTIKNLKIIRDSGHHTLSELPLKYTAMVLGIGLGGFADGIVLHQILQWHEMLTNKLPSTTIVSKSVNMFWDGVFHLFTFLITLTGIYLFWNLLQHFHINKSRNLLTGGLLCGWGIFNVLEGVINHQILKLHNVREFSSHTDLWNYGFLSFGLLLIIGGWLLMRKTNNKLKS